VNELFYKNQIYCPCSQDKSYPGGCLVNGMPCQEITCPFIFWLEAYEKSKKEGE